MRKSQLLHAKAALDTVCADLRSTFRSYPHDQRRVIFDAQLALHLLVEQRTAGAPAPQLARELARIADSLASSNLLHWSLIRHLFRTARDR